MLACLFLVVFTCSTLHISHDVNYDDTPIPENYNRARDHGPAFLAQWMNIVASHVEKLRIEKVVDLGCGTGRFSQGLAARLAADVVGIDPSRKMVREATNNRSVAKVSYVIGTGEAIPLADHSIDVVFISMAFHHFINPRAVAQECHRILRNTGRLCLRTGSSEKIPEYPYMPFFPQARQLLAAHLPSLTFQREVFEECGFSTLSAEVIVQEIAANYSDYADKIALKADSILVRLHDSDFAAGMEELRAHAATMEPQPVTEPIDFLVFGKRPHADAAHHHHRSI
jgi:ubiquinone/menaquinone biosynthesis C-methylase UbiE